MPKKVYLCDAKFLAVACSLRLLSKAEAATIFEEHGRYTKRGLGRWGCGEVALELGLLTPASIAIVLTEQDRLRNLGQQIPDPVGGAKVRGAQPPKVKIKTASAIGILVLVVLGCVAWFSRGELQPIVNAATLMALTMALALALLPAILRIPLTASGRLRWVSIPFGLGLAGFGWANAIELGEISKSAAPTLRDEIMASLDSFRLTVILLLVLLVLSDLAGKWRHWQLFNAQIRTGLLRRLVSKVYQYNADLAQVSSKDELNEMDLDRLIGKTMARAAQIISQNPWDRLSGGLLRFFGNRAYGALSLWYLEPTEDGNALQVRQFSSPNAPSEVIEAFKRIRREHRPVMFDEVNFAKAWAHACKAARENGNSPREKMMERTDRSQFMSVTGYVYRKKRVLVAHDASLCVAFDRSYLERTEPNPSELEKRWLDFNSFACFPVLDTLAAGQSVFGVLISFKNIKKGFGREEWSLLASTAKLLGLLIRSHSEARLRLESNRTTSEVA